MHPSVHVGRATLTRQALELFEQMQQRCMDSDVITHSASIGAREEGKITGQALELLEKMQRRCWHSNVITHDASIDAGEKGKAYGVGTGTLAGNAAQVLRL